MDRTDPGQTLLLEAGRRDFHVHSNVSYDTAKNCTLENIIAVAEGFGMREIGLTDHVVAVERDGRTAEGAGAVVARHRALCDAIHATASTVKVYASWEVDYYDGGGYSFDPEKHLEYLDYVLLAHHGVGHMADESPQLIARYLIGVTIEMAREPCSHIIAHPFYFPPPPDRHGRILRVITDAQFDEVFRAIDENGKAAEITPYQFSADLRDVGEMKRMYAIAKNTGVKFTLDSDAHSLWGMAEATRCLYVLAELGFDDGDFLDYRGLMELKTAAGA